MTVRLVKRPDPLIPRWIALADILPPEGQRVFILTSGRVSMGVYRSGQLIVSSDGEPTHWQPT